MGFDEEEDEDEFEDDYEALKAKRAKRIVKKKKVCGRAEFQEQRLKAPPSASPRLRIKSHEYDEDDDYESEVFYNGRWV